MARPAYLQASTDPLFGTRITRITDPGRYHRVGLDCGQSYCRHRYSSTQAWNADQSLLAIMNGCSGMCFLNGRTFAPLFHRNRSDDCKWHPTRAKEMVCVSDTRVYRWRPETDEEEVVFSPKEYSGLEFGPYKGNLSLDGSRLALRARDASGRRVMFVYDLDRRYKFPDVDLATLSGANASCDIAASGQLVICFQLEANRTETAYILKATGETVGFWPEHHRPGHGDFAVDPDGSDVYIGVSKSDPDKWHIIKRRLVDGAVTVLTPAGYGTHVSGRAIARAGWAIATFEGTREKVLSNPGWAPFYREVVAIRTDGSGEVRRLAHTYNARIDYYSESHASPSPDASRIVWSSNWGQGPVADYVVDVEW